MFALSLGTWLALVGDPARADTSPPAAPLTSVAPTTPVASLTAAPTDPRWPASPDDEAERLGRFLDAQSDSELRQYWAVAGGALAVGAPQVAIGLYMQGQSDVAAQAIGPGLIIGGAADCVLGLVPLLAPRPMSLLRGFYESERSAGKPAGEVVLATEERWRALVDRQRRARRMGCIVDLVIGVPAFATGLVFAFAKPGLGGMSPQNQYGWAGALVGFDFLVYQGVVALAAPPPIDTAFETYELLKHGSSGSVVPTVGVAPVAGGATVGVAWEF
jgi:hypothetical protein